MPLSANTVSVTTADTIIFTPAGARIDDPIPVSIWNNDAATTVYIGGLGVTTTAGFPLKAGTGLSFRLLTGDIIHGIVTTGTVDVRYLAGRQ